MGQLLSGMARCGGIECCYLYSLVHFELQRLFQVGYRHRSQRNDIRQRSGNPDAQQPARFESTGTQTGEFKVGLENESCDKRYSRSFMESSIQENDQETSNNLGTESFATERNKNLCDEPDNVKGNVRSQNESNGDCHGDCTCGSNSDHFAEYENVSLGDVQHGGWPEDPRCQRMSSLSPVKEETASDVSSEADRAIHDPGTYETYPVFEDSEIVPRVTLSRHGTDLARCKAHGFRTKLMYCSVSSDSGIGDALRGSYTSTSSVCVSTSDSSDCNSSTHSYDLSSTSHTDDLECCDGAANDVFDHDLLGGEEPQSTEDHCEMNDLDSQGSDNFDWSKPQKSPEDQTATPRTHRPAPRLLNFRARRKVTFCEEVPNDDVQLDIPANFRGSVSSPPSSVSASSSFQNFRPVFGRQDSEDSCSSVSSTDSVLAVPLSPDSPTASGQSSAFIFPESTTEKHCFAEPREGCDLVLLAEGERFHVHSAVVAWQCGALLQHLHQTGASEVVLLDKRAGDVLSLLYLLYPYHRQSITEHNVEGLVELAHYLGCERVLRLCTTYLMGLAHFPHLCSHGHLSPSHLPYPAPSSRLRTSSTLREGSGSPPSTSPEHFHPGERLEASSLCSCADTMVERVLDILLLAANYELEDVYHTYLDVTAKVKATDLTSCPRFKHMSALIRQDILMSRLTRLENVVSNVNLKESNLLTCRHQRHDGYRLTFTGPLCLKCCSKSLLREAHNSG